MGDKEVTVKLAESREVMASTKGETAQARLPPWTARPTARPERDDHSFTDDAPNWRNNMGPSPSGPPSLPNKIFVGGLPRSVGTSQLSSYFEHYGSLSDAVVMPDRGFGFVAFHDERALDDVFADADIHSIEGQRITVKLADGHRPPAQPGYGPNRGGLPSRMAAAPFGGKGYGGAHQGDGGNVRSGPYNGASGMMASKGRFGDGSARKIFVGGLPKDFPTMELENHFCVYGRIVDCVAIPGRGFGFVEFDDPSSVDAAMRDGDTHVVAGNQVNLRIADGKKGPPTRGPPAPMTTYQRQPLSATGAMSRPSAAIGGGKGNHCWSEPMSFAPVGRYAPARGGGGCKIFVRGLPDILADEELADFFSRYGEITDSKVMSGRGFGFVTFAHKGSASAVIGDRIDMGGQELIIKLADGLKGTGPRGSAPY